MEENKISNGILGAIIWSVLGSLGLGVIGIYSPLLISICAIGGFIQGLSVKNN